MQDIYQYVLILEVVTYGQHSLLKEKVGFTDDFFPDIFCFLFKELILKADFLDWNLKNLHLLSFESEVVDVY